MWLTPCSITSSRVRSATSWVTRASAAAPKIVFVLLCPVRPNGCVAIIAMSLSCTSTSTSVGSRQVDVHRLNADAAGAGEAIEHQPTGAAEDAGLEAVHLLIHTHALVAVDPAARLDIDLLARPQHLLEDVAVAVQPDDALVVRGRETIDEEAGRAEEHVGDALLAAEAIVDVAHGGEELVLAHLDRLARLEVNREDVPGAVAGEGDLAGVLGLREEDRHAGDHALKGALQPLHTDLQARRLPEDDVVLEVERHRAVQRDVELRHELALDAVGDAGRTALGHLVRQQLRGVRHGALLGSARPRASGA